jgi:GNAT superfamily N-acetyltransferase
MTIHPPAAPADSETLYNLISALAEYEKLTHLVEATPQKLCDALFGAHPGAEAVILEVDTDSGKLPVGFALFPQLLDVPGQAGALPGRPVRRPAWRGHGLGKALLKHLAALAVERGCAASNGRCSTGTSRRSISTARWVPT